MSTVKLSEDIRVLYPSNPINKLVHTFKSNTDLDASIDLDEETIWLKSPYGDYPISLSDKRVQDLRL